MYCFPARYSTAATLTLLLILILMPINSISSAAGSASEARAPALGNDRSCVLYMGIYEEESKRLVFALSPSGLSAPCCVHEVAFLGQNLDAYSQPRSEKQREIVNEVILLLPNSPGFNVKKKFQTLTHWRKVPRLAIQWMRMAFTISPNISFDAIHHLS